jgi:hypothetical protein
MQIAAARHVPVAPITLRTANVRMTSGNRTPMTTEQTSGTSQSGTSRPKTVRIPAPMTFGNRGRAQIERLGDYVAAIRETAVTLFRIDIVAIEFAVQGAP